MINISTYIALNEGNNSVVIYCRKSRQSFPGALRLEGVGKSQRVPRGGGCWFLGALPVVGPVASSLPSLRGTCGRSCFSLSDGFAKETGLVQPQAWAGAGSGVEMLLVEPLWRETGGSGRF